jgi:hypothetical protein
METNDINKPFPIKWKPVYDAKYVVFEKDFVVAVVRDLNDERIVCCVRPAMVKCMEVRGE